MPERIRVAADVYQYLFVPSFRKPNMGISSKENFSGREVRGVVACLIDACVLIKPVNLDIDLRLLQQVGNGRDQAVHCFVT